MALVRYTDYPWWSVEDAAKLLRVNVHTLYRACAADDFPHSRSSGFIKIPAEALMLTVRPETRTRTYHVTDEQDPMQLAFSFDVPLIPVRRYRNTREPVKMGDYETSLSINRRWRNPDNPVD